MRRGQAFRVAEEEKIRAADAERVAAAEEVMDADFFFFVCCLLGFKGASTTKVILSP